MMSEKVFILGCSNESMNAAIVMASQDKEVVFLCYIGEVEDILNHYKFEKQMVALWDLYIKQAKIQILTDISSGCQQLFADKKYQEASIWLFLDVLKTQEIANLSQSFVSPYNQVIISGLSCIGQVSVIANTLVTQWVFYFPLVFMKDGEGFTSLLKPDVLFIGEKTAETFSQCNILMFFIKNSKKHFVSDIRTVEFTRSTLMAMLATRLSFINEIARLADAEAVDIVEVQRALALDNRIGEGYLSAGWGYGGNTLPLEMDLLKQCFVKDNIRSALLDVVTSINEDQKELIFRKFWRHFDGFIENKTVVIWGAGYRSDTGRTTNSAIHPLLKLLWSYRIKTIIYATNTALKANKHQY